MHELPLAAFASETGSHLLREPSSERYQAFLRTFDEEGYRRELERKGVRFVGRSDPGFPARLALIHDPPPGLFVRGRAALDLLGRPAVAVVGARACSSYGTGVALTLGRELAAAGAVVVSGLDRDYPRAHASLAAAIAERGLILSEYAPGVEPAPWRFPARNRIVAGLAQATVVVEARERSGALITADLALDE